MNFDLSKLEGLEKLLESKSAVLKKIDLERKEK